MNLTGKPVHSPVRGATLVRKVPLRGDLRPSQAAHSAVDSCFVDWMIEILKKQNTFCN